MRAMYALYKGDDFIDCGTAFELAARRGVDVKTIYWLATSSNRKRGDRTRLVAYRLEER